MDGSRNEGIVSALEAFLICWRGGGMGSIAVAPQKLPTKAGEPGPVGRTDSSALSDDML